MSRKPPDNNFTRTHELSIKDQYSGGRATMRWEDVDDPDEWQEYLATVRARLAKIRLV